MRENLEIVQEAGLGDVFFIQKLCKILNKNNKVYHKINPFIWSNGANRLTSNITFGPNLTIPVGTKKYDCSHQYNVDKMTDKSRIMTYKYDAASIDWRDWAKYFTYTRNLDAEKELVKKYKTEGPYILANSLYGSCKRHNGVEESIPKDFDGDIIWMDLIPGYTIFDWCSLLENAEEIHIVDTSLNYLVDTLDIKAKRLVCHPRHFINTQPCVGKLFAAPWEWIQYDRDSWRRLVPDEGE